MAVASLPVELFAMITEQFTDEEDVQSLARLSCTCKGFYSICVPLLYRNITRERISYALLPIAYNIFTLPHIAQAVRSIELPPLRRNRTIRTPWKRQFDHPWPAHAEQQSIRYQVTAALSHRIPDLAEECMQLVCDGSAEDWIAMLVLANTPNLKTLTLGQISVRNDILITRELFSHAASKLHKLSKVEFGNNLTEVYAAYLEHSFEIFADLFRLPAVQTILSNSLAPELPGSTLHQQQTYLSHILQIDIENTSIEELVLSEQLACHPAYLAYLLKRCLKLKRLEFLGDADSKTQGWGSDSSLYYESGLTWEIGEFQKALEYRANSLQDLTLGELLAAPDAEIYNPLCDINLRGLGMLTHLHLDDVWLFEGKNQRGGWREHNPQLLASMLPESIESVSIFISNNISHPFSDCIVHQCCCLQGVIEQHREKQCFPNLSKLGLKSYLGDEDDEWKHFEETAILAMDAGLTFWFWDSEWERGKDVVSH